VILVGVTMSKQVVLADADIFIHLNRLQHFNLIEKLTEAYCWDLKITNTVKDECKDPLTSSKIKSLIKNNFVNVIEESSKEVTLNIKKLNKSMEAGAEIELFAISMHKGYNIITHDRKNTNVYINNYGRDCFYVYNLYHLLYLAYKAQILKIEQIQIPLLKYLKKKNVKSDMYNILKSHGFTHYCKKLDENVNKHIDPKDQAKFIR